MAPPCSPGVPCPGRDAQGGAPRAGRPGRGCSGRGCRAQAGGLELQVVSSAAARDASMATSAAPRCRAAAGGGAARRATYASDRLLRQSVTPPVPPSLDHCPPPNSPLAQREPLRQRHARVELPRTARCGLPSVRPRVSGRDVCRLVGAGRVGEHTHTRAHVHTSRHGACVHGACLLHGSSEHIRSAQRKPRRALSGETSRRSAEGGRRLRHLCTCTDRVPRAVAPKLTAAVLTRVALAVAVPRMGMRARVLYSVWHLELQLVLADGARVASPVRRPTSDAAVQPRHLHASVGRGVGQGAIRAGACVHVLECDGAAALGPACSASRGHRRSSSASIPSHPPRTCMQAHAHADAGACRVRLCSRPPRPPTTPAHHAPHRGTSASEASSSTRAAPSAAPRGAPRSGASSCAQKAGRSISSRDQIAARSRSASGSVRPCRVLELRGRRGGRSGSGRGRRSRRSRRGRRPRREFPAATAAAAVAASTSRSRRDRPGD